MQVTATGSAAFTSIQVMYISIISFLNITDLRIDALHTKTKVKTISNRKLSTL